MSSWKWSSSNMTASRSEAPQWSIRPSLIRSPTKHNTPPTRLNAGPCGGATYFPPYHNLPDSQLSWEVLLVQKPFSLFSLVPVWLSTLKILLHRMPHVHASVWIVCDCLWDCVLCNAFFLLMSADISSFDCPFFFKCCLHLLSACLWAQFSSSEC